MARRWTQQEIEFLKENYGKTSPKKLSQKLNRTITAISAKAYRLQHPEEYSEHRRYMRKWYWQHREERREYGRKYYQKHKEKFKEYGKHYRERVKNNPELREHVRKIKREQSKRSYRQNPKKFRERMGELKKKYEAIWGCRTKRGGVEWRRAEAFAERLLLHEDFTDCVHFNQYFPFDYLCVKDGEKYGVDVTVTTHKNVKESQKKLMRFFGIRFIVLFIKPDLSKYLIRETTFPFKAIGILNMKWLKQLKPTPKNLLLKPIKIPHGQRKNERGILKMRRDLRLEQIPQEYLGEN